VFVCFAADAAAHAHVPHLARITTRCPSYESRIIKRKESSERVLVLPTVSWAY